MSVLQNEVRACVQQRLDEIEQGQDLRVVFACESGSRAWGFASADSDYDVRFLYVREPDWYMSVDVEDKSEVIEPPIEGELDVSGWDIRKALRLLRKSNPPLMEWLTSPLVYREDPRITSVLRELLPIFYSPIACHYHYLRMAKRHFDTYLDRPLIAHKRYFYTLRPLLALRWIEGGHGPVPMAFSKLVEGVLQDDAVRVEIARLIEAKRHGGEADLAPPIPLIHTFITNELQRYQQQPFAQEYSQVDRERLNTAFREIVTITWSS
jgi:hypothetical protein